MAAVARFLYCEGHPSHGDYGSAMTQPWTIGWDEDDTRIRLNFIARAWVAMRSAMRPEGADYAGLVWPWPFSYVFFLRLAWQLSCRRGGREPGCRPAVRTLRLILLTTSLEHSSTSGTYVALQLASQSLESPGLSGEMPSSGPKGEHRRRIRPARYERPG